MEVGVMDVRGVMEVGVMVGVMEFGSDDRGLGVEVGGDGGWG